MTMVENLGKPSFFLTMTANPQWPEIQRVLEGTNLRAHDRPDIVMRVFAAKVKQFEKELPKVFGNLRGLVWTLEFQQRGLPYIHCLIWRARRYNSAAQVDSVISANIPKKSIDPELYEIVVTNLIHDCTKRKCVQRTNSVDGTIRSLSQIQQTFQQTNLVSTQG